MKKTWLLGSPVKQEPTSDPVSVPVTNGPVSSPVSVPVKQEL